MGRAAPHRLSRLDGAHLIASRLPGGANSRNDDPRVRSERLAQEAQLLTRRDYPTQPRVHRRAPESLSLEADIGHAASQHTLQLRGVMGSQDRDANHP